MFESKDVSGLLSALREATNENVPLNEAKPQISFMAENISKLDIDNCMSFC